MSTPHHTPGPWVLRRSITAHPYATADVLTPDGELLALTFAGHDRKRQPADANARLIAAAPELLAALEKMIEPYGPADDCWQIREARAAIAKARGEG